MMGANIKTRPARFDWVSNFNADGTRERIYRLTEPRHIHVIDASHGAASHWTRITHNPGCDRHRVSATVVDEWDRARPYRAKTEWVVWTKGYSNHGNSSTRRVFDTLEEAERHIKRWATRRWRVVTTCAHCDSPIEKLFRRSVGDVPVSPLTGEKVCLNCARQHGMAADRARSLGHLEWLIRNPEKASRYGVVDYWTRQPKLSADDLAELDAITKTEGGAA